MVSVFTLFTTLSIYVMFNAFAGSNAEDNDGYFFDPNYHRQYYKSKAGLSTPSYVMMFRTTPPVTPTPAAGAADGATTQMSIIRKLLSMQKHFTLPSLTGKDNKQARVGKPNWAKHPQSVNTWKPRHPKLQLKYDTEAER